jgi:hypothetical protein
MKRLESKLMTMCALILSACSAAPDIGEATAESVDQALTDPALVLGFENTSYWTASSGSKSSTTDRTQGAAALAVSNFTYTKLISVPLSNLTGVNSTLRLDVKPPSSLPWGQIQVFVNIPSKGINNVGSNVVSLAGLSASAYSTLSFTLPANVVSALSAGGYSDANFEIAFSTPQTSAAFKVDNLRFQGSTSTNSLIELRISNVDDYVYVTVDGVRRKISYIGDPTQGVKEDVSSWFGAGNNPVRIQNVNTGGPTSYTLELWVDGQLVINDSAPAGITAEGIVVDKTITVNTPNRPAFQTVTVNSSPGGKLYLNDTYTGKTTPTTLTLPQGPYKLGLGVSTDTPPNYTGSFYEQSIALGAAAQTVNLTSTAPLGLKKTDTVVVIPVQNSWNYTAAAGQADPNNNGVLAQSDVPLLAGQFNATRDQWFRPFSYGLSTWQVTVLPMVTNTPLREDQPGNIDIDKFITAAGFDNLRSQYDRIVVYFSQQRPDGTNVSDHYGSVFALGRQLVGYQAEYAKFRTATQPSPWLLHEFLHNHEAYNDGVLHEYNGVSGLHGAEQHGYYSENNSGETDYVKFYRLYMRSQVAELNTMRPDLKPPAPPSSSDLYVGLFKTLRVYSGK